MSHSRLTPEEQAQAELAQTEALGPRTARTMVLVFLLIVGLIIPSQWIYEATTGRSFQLLDLFGTPYRAADLAAFEDAVEDASFARTAVQPRLQAWFSQFGGFGNTKTVLGREGWLYYEPGVSHLAGSDPFSPEHLNRRQLAGQRNPDPRPAIQAFHEDLAALGIELILLPIPDKASVHPEFLTRRQTQPFPDPALQRLTDWAEERGIQVLSVEEELFAERSENGTAYLAQDTHWTPVAMERVARFVSQAVILDNPPARTWQQEAQEAIRVGDLVDMLQLVDHQKVFRPEQIRINQIQDEEGQPWDTRANAPVLLLGDSFTNIFHLAEMGWGESAGFGAHLAAALGTDLKQIAINGGGSDATRIELSRMRQGLRNVQTVVWQFSARDLSHGAWPVVRVSLREAEEEDPEETTGETADEHIQIRGRILIGAPTPSLAAPYENARGAFLLEVVSAEGPRHPEVGEEILLQIPLMVERRLRPATRWREGQEISIAVQRGVPSEWSGRELLDETFIFDDRTIYWGLE